MGTNVSLQRPCSDAHSLGRPQMLQYDPNRHSDLSPHELKIFLKLRARLSRVSGQSVAGHHCSEIGFPLCILSQVILRYMRLSISVVSGPVPSSLGGLSSTTVLKTQFSTRGSIRSPETLSTSAFLFKDSDRAKSASLFSKYTFLLHQRKGS